MLKQPLISSLPTFPYDSGYHWGPRYTKNRHELDDAIKILRAASKGARKRELNHRCNLAPTVFGKYVSALTELDLLEVKDGDGTSYRTTDKGLELLHTYFKLRWLLWGGTFDFMFVGLLGRLKTDRKERKKYSAYIS